MPKSYEVELKFRIEQFDQIWRLLQPMGAVRDEVVSHYDRYFNHPSRDFRLTDEAFRIRSIGDKNLLTYKGAVLGTVAKTRHEIEVPFAQGPQTANQLVEMMTLLGFRFVREVRKNRQKVHIARNNRQFEIALDEVPGLGSFIEIELIAEDDDRSTAEAAVWELARDLGLSQPETRSYLDLLINGKT